MALRGADAFETLLAALDSDRQRAGERYEEVRLTLLKFFEWRRSACPEELADETIDRVARRLHEGEVIQAASLLAYFCGVARNVLREDWRARARTAGVPDGLAGPLAAADPDARELREQRLQCLSGCLERLPQESRELIIQYYQLDKGAKIAHRTRLAEAHGLPINALRLRVHRIRAKLEACVRECLARREGRATSFPDSATR